MGGTLSGNGSGFEISHSISVWYLCGWLKQCRYAINSHWSNYKYAWSWWVVLNRMVNIEVMIGFVSIECGRICFDCLDWTKWQYLLETPTTKCNYRHLLETPTTGEEFTVWFGSGKLGSMVEISWFKHTIVVYSRDHFNFICLFLWNASSIQQCIEIMNVHCGSF